MLALISTLLSWLACRFRSRAELELERIALRSFRGSMVACAIPYEHFALILANCRARLEVDGVRYTFTARTWPGRYMLPLAVFLGSKSSTKS